MPRRYTRLLRRPLPDGASERQQTLLAKARGVPAFVILNDKALQAIACARPTSLAALLQIEGTGPRLVEKHGAAILQVMHG